MMVTMVWSLRQNVAVISQNGQTLKATVESLELQKLVTSNALRQLDIEEKTRLHPDLACAYDSINKLFVLHNGGSAPATNIFLTTSVLCVTSNQAVDFQGPHLGTGFSFPCLSSNKNSLLPGEQSYIAAFFTPEMGALREIWNEFGDDVLVRIRIDYE